MSDYKLKNVCDFDLAQTLECGQCFHFVKLDEEDYVLDTLAQYPGDPTLGKLTFMINLKNQSGTREVAEFNGVGKSVLTMSLGYKLSLIHI